MNTNSIILHSIIVKCKLLIVSDIEVIDFFKYRSNKDMVKGFRPAMLAFMSSLSVFRHQKESIITPSLQSYVDPALNALQTEFDASAIDHAYNSCTEEDDPFFRVDEKWYSLKKDFTKGKVTIRRNDMACKFLSQILQELKTEGMHGKYAPVSNLILVALLFWSKRRSFTVG
jgi:hypothetical protein